MAEQDFLVWGAAGGNVMSQANYAANPNLANGVPKSATPTTGIAIIGAASLWKPGSLHWKSRSQSPERRIELMRHDQPLWHPSERGLSLQAELKV